MRLLVFGQTGQIARELQRLAPEARFLGRAEADLSDPTACAAVIAGCDAVINAAAWTAVDKAETEEAAATLVNGSAPGAMARVCAAQGIPFAHVSTDYVFDGQGTRPFAPSDPVAPLNAYGRSKRAGEQAVMDAGARALVLRTSWVVSAHGANFVKTMLRLGRERESLKVVADQIGGPTPARAIAEALLTATRAMREGAPGGIHHFSGSPDTSWADFAGEIMVQAGLPCRIEDIPTEAYPTPARRPANSRLDCSAFTAAFGVARPDWRAHLTQIIEDLA